MWGEDCLNGVQVDAFVDETTGTYLPAGHADLRARPYGRQGDPASRVPSSSAPLPRSLASVRRSQDPLPQSGPPASAAEVNSTAEDILPTVSARFSSVAASPSRRNAFACALSTFSEAFAFRSRGEGDGSYSVQLLRERLHLLQTAKLTGTTAGENCGRQDGKLVMEQE